MAKILKLQRLNARAQRRLRAELPAGTPAPDAELIVYGPIGDSMWEETVTARQVVEELAALDSPQHILVRINSLGGSVLDGLAIHNALQATGAKITVRIEAVAASIASLIAMAGDTIRIYPNALMMIHAPWGYTAGNAAETRKAADVLDVHAKAMAVSYAEKTGLSADEILSSWLDGKEDHWLTAAEAVDAGFADELIASTRDDQAAAAARNASVRDALVAFGVASPLAARLAPQAVSFAGPHAPSLYQAVPPAAPAAQPKVSLMDWKALARALGLTVAADADSAAVKAQVLAHLSLTDDATDDAVARAMLAARPATAATVPPAAPAAPAAVTRREQIEGMFAVALRGPRAQNTSLLDLRDRALIDEARSVEAVRAELLAALDNGATPLAGSHVAGGEDEADKRRKAMTQATLARMGRAQADGGNPYRGYRLLDIVRDSLEASGQNTRGLSSRDLADRVFAAGNTTSDFPVVLENTMHKILLDGFSAVPQTWASFCKTGDVSDFRDWNRLVPGLIGNLDGVLEGGEYKNKNLPDAQKNKIRATRHGNIVRITPEVLVNDDIGYIQNTLSGLGMAGARAIDRAVYKVLASNPVLSDGKALFHASHKNIASAGAAPSVDAFDAIRVAMSKQTFPGEDAEFMDLKPAITVCAAEIEGVVRATIASPFDPDATNKLQRPNIVHNLTPTIVSSPRITSTTAWYVFANPAIAPVIEVVFLDGQRAPQLTAEPHFATSGLQWKVELPFGVGAIDYRGAYYNAGA